jgi:hypothetical protein
VSLRGRGVLGDGLGALGHGMLGELAREREAHGGLDLARREGALLVVAHELASLVGDLVEDVGDEGVHDRHALGRDARVGVHLLEHLVDVDGVGLAPLLLALPALGALSLRLLLFLDLLFLRLRGHAAEAHVVDESFSRRAPPFQGSVSPDQHKSARAWRYGNPQIAQETQGRALGAAQIITAVAPIVKAFFRWDMGRQRQRESAKREPVQRLRGLRHVRA